MKNKSIILIISILFIGLGIAGGTYAFLSSSVNATNNSYNTVTGCFNIDYTIDNGDSTQDITGTLFPSSGPSGGLSGRVSLKTNASCNLDGIGTLKLHINSGTSSTLMTSASSYCENRKTMEAISGISTQEACAEAGGRWRGYGDSYCESNTTLERLTDYTESTCSGNDGTWKNGGSPLKYAVYDNSAGTGTPLSKGYITSSDIGYDVTIYPKFVISSTEKYYYIFVWLDGYLVDNTINNLPFNGYINASAVQVNDAVPSGYQRVEYIQSSGTQYIDTGYKHNQDTRVLADIDFQPTSSWKDPFGSYGGPNASPKKMLAAEYDGNTTLSLYYGNASKQTITTKSLYTGRKIWDFNKNVWKIGSTTKTFSTQTFQSQFNFIIFARSGYDGTIGGQTNVTLYSFKIYDNGTLVRNFVPAKYGNVVGLYDNINDVFYENAGSGSFTAGPNT